MSARAVAERVVQLGRIAQRPRMGEHIIDGEFQSNKYPETPRGLVPLKCSDPMAQDLLWEYARRRRAVDPEFADDIKGALRLKGYTPMIGALSNDRAAVVRLVEAAKDWRVKRERTNAIFEAMRRQFFAQTSMPTAPWEEAQRIAEAAEDMFWFTLAALRKGEQ